MSINLSSSVDHFANVFVGHFVSLLVDHFEIHVDHFAQPLSIIFSMPINNFAIVFVGQIVSHAVDHFVGLFLSQQKVWMVSRLFLCKLICIS
jgi:hypothetical protein